MSRLSLAAALLLVAPAAVAQAITRPVVTASAGTMRAAFPFSDGRTFYAVGLGGEFPVAARGPLTVSLGAAGRAASDVFGGSIRPQSVMLFARLGTAQASGRLGVALDLGSGFFEPDNTSGINSDGQTAVVAQLSGTQPIGGVRAFGAVDAALALATGGEAFITSREDVGGQRYPLRVSAGHQGSIRAGAAVPVGPVEVAVAVFAAGRTEGFVRYTSDALPLVEGDDGTLAPAERESPFQLGYTRTVGLVPSVIYRAPGGRLTLRADGSYAGYFTMEDTSLGVTLSSENGPSVRSAVTLSASVGL